LINEAKAIVIGSIAAVAVSAGSAGSTVSLPLRVQFSRLTLCVLVFVSVETLSKD
jgi:hypothetical protein